MITKTSQALDRITDDLERAQQASLDRLIIQNVLRGLDPDENVSDEMLPQVDASLRRLCKHGVLSSDIDDHHRPWYQVEP